MHGRRKWQPTPVFVPGESQGQRILLGCCLWGHTELDATDDLAAAATKRRLVYYIPPVVRFCTLENIRQILKEQILLISLCLIMIIL